MQLHLVDIATLESCAGSTATALGMVMSGTGHLPSLKLFRSLRVCLPDRSQAISYGYQMAINSSIGLLFLGGGRFALDNSLPSIGALVCAFYPRYPLSTADNRYHLQPWRHLWALAARPRSLHAVDVETGRQCYVPLKIHVKGNEAHGYSGNELNVTSPCLLPPLEQLSRVSVNSDRFWPMSIDLTAGHVASTLAQQRVIYVKRKAGYLGYEQDPGGRRSILTRSFPRSNAQASDKEAFIKAFSADSTFLSFAHHFCVEAADPFFPRVMYECLSREKPEVMRTYLELFQIMRDLQRGQVSLHDIWNLKLVLAFYRGRSLGQQSVTPSSSSHVSHHVTGSHRRPLPRHDSKRNLSSKLNVQQKPAVHVNSQAASASEELIQPALLSSVHQRMETFFNSIDFAENTHQYAQHPLKSFDKITTSTASLGHLFGAFLVFFEIPYPSELRKCFNQFNQIQQMVGLKKDDPSVLPLLALAAPKRPVSSLQKIVTDFL